MGAEKEIVNRCFWVNMANPLYVAYHDEEWGVRVHDDDRLFKMLILEGFQAGLSWECILNKREAFEEAFEGFCALRMASWGQDKVEELMNNPGIVRNRRKIEGAIINAGVFLRLQEEFGSFDRYLMGFAGEEPVIEPCDLRTTSPLSDAISKDLKKRGMKFAGSTIIYSYLQAVGVINGHAEGCDCLQR